MMKISLECHSQKSCPLNIREMEALVRTVFKKAGFLFARKSISLSLALVSPAEIKKLNKRYRKKDSVTDILSFGEYPGPRELKKEKGKDIFLGELVICCSVVKKSAKLNEVSFRNEFGYIFSHGVLHLLGFEHGEKMFAIQDGAVRKMK